MPINFVTLLQDSWNFIRNNSRFTLIFMLIFSLSSFLTSLYATHYLTDNLNKSQMETFDPSLFILGFGALFSGIFLQFWLILSIQAISQGQRHFMSVTLAKSIKLSLLMSIYFILFLLLLSLPMSFLSILVVGSPVFLLPIIALVLYLSYGRLSVFLHVYLLEEPQLSIMQAIKKSWQLSKNYQLMALAFGILVYALPFGTGVLINDPNGYFIPVQSFISILLSVFGVRFYQHFRTLLRTN